MDTNTPDLLTAARGSTLDICRGLHLTTETASMLLGNGVLLVVDDIQVDTEGGQGGSERRNGTGANTSDRMLGVVDLNDTGEPTLQVLGVKRLARLRRGRRLGAVGGDVVVDQVEAGVGLEVVCLLEQVDNLGRTQLAADGLGLSLNNLAELDLQGAREIQLQTAQNNPSGATLATLGVDPNNSFVVSANILRVEGEVRDDPFVVVGGLGLFAELESLRNCVLVTSTESRCDESTSLVLVSMFSATNCEQPKLTYGQRSLIGILLLSSTTLITALISEKSTLGETPCVYRFKARVTRSTLPVRSPFPKRVPSTRWAPPICANSAAATAHPRSLCG